MRSKLFRIGFGVSLAVFMGMAGVFGGLAVLPKTAFADSESFSTEASGLIVPKADDPVIFTTESGIDIKYANAGVAIAESLLTGALKGYPYFTMGTWNGTPINWVIIGQGLRTVLEKSNSVEDNSPAGNAIKSDIKFNFEKYARLDVVKNAEIADGCVLCYSEKAMYVSVSVRNESNYEGSLQQTQMINYYNSTLGFSTEQKSVIVPQTFTNIYYPSNVSTSTNQYLFPLAGRGEKFSIQTYLPTADLRVATLFKDGLDYYERKYWLRSGDSVLAPIDGNQQVMHVSSADGVLSSGRPAVYDVRQYRPAFVMKLS